jgi:hypothetical protein
MVPMFDLGGESGRRERNENKVIRKSKRRTEVGQASAFSICYRRIPRLPWLRGHIQTIREIVSEASARTLKHDDLQAPKHFQAPLFQNQDNSSVQDKFKHCYGRMRDPI